VTDTGPPANWYADPDGSGGLRYWDGVAWTGHRAPATPPGYTGYAGYAAYPGYVPWGAPPWKGAQLGRPAHGPGALADPGHRLAARMLDWAVMLRVLAALLTVSLDVAAPHFGPILPRTNLNDPNATVPVPGLVWIYLTVFGCMVCTGLVMVAYETVGVAHFGRTLGMAWLHIRPVRVFGGTLGWGRSFGRAAMFWLAGALGWIGLLDPLWCLWDDRRQCLHDKVVDSIVINDIVAPGHRAVAQVSQQADASPV
jgi:uncharacterized RDD family membrane protein YckC